ncbi:DUF3231 family protein [Litchfieldia salsa]|uniref:DUF3231 family protein n=1 Tax=Litchfieldia salsa TaxID=930152 RepID=A0A1H0T759_9BACI|nr:DUF3231 family protein [Litchfieldia salsa]SDP49849.1 Protein of unknown function [Litchfieldia salsa]
MNEMSHNVKLTSSEIGNLWSQYINDSMSLCILSHYLKHVQDNEIRSILEFADQLSKTHVNKIKTFLKEDEYPIPVGFTKDDVNLDAPPIFTDTFMLIYIRIMTVHGLTGYAGALATSIRSDQIDYFSQCISETTELYRRIMDVLIKKGIESRPPNINPPSEIDFVQKQSFLTGWFGERRPLNAIEVSGIFFNMKKNVVKIVLEIGFAQVAKSKEISEYIRRGEKICDKHYSIFESMLSENNLPSPQKHGDEVTSSKISPFSDKLMLFHIVTLISTASGYYGAAFSLSQRRDLALKYPLLIAEIVKYAEDGVNILIDRGWLEQPPTFDDRGE